MNIGTKIKQRITELGWSQWVLASKMGYKDNSTLARIEQGKVDVSQSRLEQFCKILKVNMFYFLKDDCVDKNDAEFMDSLGYIYPKEDLPPEIEAINTLLNSQGNQIMRVKGNYYFDEAGELSEDELNEFLNTAIMTINNVADILIQKKTKQLKTLLSGT